LPFRVRTDRGEKVEVGEKKTAKKAERREGHSDKSARNSNPQKTPQGARGNPKGKAQRKCVSIEKTRKKKLNRRREGTKRQNKPVRRKTPEHPSAPNPMAKGATA